MMGGRQVKHLTDIPLPKESLTWAQTHSCLPELKGSCHQICLTSLCSSEKSQSSSIFQLLSLHLKGEPQDGCFKTSAKENIT